MIDSSRRSLVFTAASLSILGAAAPKVRAQAPWPRQPIRLIVTFPPGGASDLVARVLAPILSQSFGQPVVVENRPGAGSTIGAAAVANSAPDGHVLLVSNSAPLSISPYLLAKPPYDPVASFTHIAYLGAVPTVFVVHPSVPAKDLAGLVAWLRTRADATPFGSGGSASVGHIIGEQFAKLAGVKLVHVAYRGAGPMRTDLVGGQIPFSIDALPQNLPLMRSGQLRLLAVTSPARVPQAPDVPTVVEAGYPALVAENYVGISAPAGLDPVIADRLHAAFNDAIAQPAVQSNLAAQGFVTATRSRPAFESFVREQAGTWAPLVKATGATL